TGHQGTVASLSFSPDDKWLASASADGTARLYEVATGKSSELKGHTDRLSAVAWCPDGKRLATASKDKTARIWVPGAPAATKILPGERMGLNTLAWSADGKTLATAGGDGTIRLWTSDGALVKTIDKIQDGAPEVWVQITTLAFTPNGKELLYTGIGRTGHA